MKRERARAARANGTAMRVAGVEEGKGGKAMVMATRVAGKWTATARMRAMVTKTKEAGEEEGNGKGGKSDGDGEEDSDGEQ
jgi:hypothetical protein